MGFQMVRVYMESKGQFFNYLRSEQALAAERQEVMLAQEQENDAQRAAQREELWAAEQKKRGQRLDREANRRQQIAESEASLSDSEAQPLRQYLLTHVVPTLTDGLSEVCKTMPEDPIEHLAQYLFAHAQDIAPQLEAHARRNF